MVVIRQVPNGDNENTSKKQFQALYTDVKHWDKLTDFIKKKFSQQSHIACL